MLSPQALTIELAIFHRIQGSKIYDSINHCLCKAISQQESHYRMTAGINFKDKDTNKSAG
jgi:hypothetical protein